MWWTAIYGDGRKFTSDEISFRDLPDLYDLDMTYGHRFWTSDLTFQSGRVEASLSTGDIRIDGVSIAVVPDPSRLILFRRTTRTNSPTDPILHHIGIGLIDLNGNGFQVWAREDGKTQLIPIRDRLP